MERFCSYYAIRSNEEGILKKIVIDDEIVTYYFANNYQWKNLKVYMWGKHENAEYPGKLFAHAPVKNKDGADSPKTAKELYEKYWSRQLQR